MMADPPLDTVLAMQTGSGAFPSIVESLAGTEADETCFVTAGVLLLLIELSDRIGPAAPLDRAIERGLVFIDSCADPDLPGAFRFYPVTGSGYQVRRDLPPDADDTALAWMVLLGTGLRSPDQAAMALAPLLDLTRVRARARGDLPWMRSGVHRTWFDRALAVNPADLCVNANLLACSAMAGLPPDPGLADTVDSALRRWPVAQGSLRVLAPYYAHPDEIGFAADRARRAGALPVCPAWPLPSAPPEDQPLYCNSHGHPIWRSPALQRARHLQRALIQPKEIVHAPDAAICS